MEARTQNAPCLFVALPPRLTKRYVCPPPRQLYLCLRRQDLETAFSEWGPLRSAFTVAKGEQRAGCSIGFVHYALAEDAQRALDAVKTKGLSIKGKAVQVELALRKNVSVEQKEKQIKEGKTARPATDAPPRKKAAPKRRDGKTAVGGVRATPSSGTGSALVLAFAPVAVAFNKKQLYKRVRKCGELRELIFPYDAAHRAKALFTSAQEAQKASARLEGHSFKGHKITILPATLPSLKSHRLIVRNLPFTLQEEQLRTAASAYGTVLEVSLPRKAEGGQPRGFAFIQMSAAAEAQRLMDALNGTELAGRLVAIDWAVSKETFAKMQAQESAKPTPSSPPQETTGGEEHEEEEEEEIDVENDSGSEDSHASASQGRQRAVDDAEQDAEVDIENDEDLDNAADASHSLNSTVFIRNVSFATEEGDLLEALSVFGPLEYCKIVRDPGTGTPKGSAFAKFIRARDAQAACEASARLSQDRLEAAEVLETDAAAAAPTGTTHQAKPPVRTELEQSLSKVEDRLLELTRRRTGKEFRSLVGTAILVADDRQRRAASRDGAATPDAQCGVVVDGRALSIVPAVDRNEAARLKKESNPGFLDAGPQDRRNLYLLNESNLKPKTALARKFWPTIDQKQREILLKERRKELRDNPNLFVSRTRLSIRYLPVAVQEGEIKRVLRTAVQRALAVADGEEGYPVIDEKLSQTLTERPFLKQVKIVRETGRERSKGYAFAEYGNHLHALLAVRYLTNYAPGLWRELLAEKFPRRRETEAAYRAKAPVIEFATEKTAVVKKRLERLQRQNQPSTTAIAKRPAGPISNAVGRQAGHAPRRHGPAKRSKK